MNSGDLLLEWCSLRGTGTRTVFERAADGLVGAPEVTSLLHQLEVLGHLEVDWEETGRWWVTPPVLGAVDGAGGNAVLIGARTRATWVALNSLRAEGTARDVAAVEQGDFVPAAWFVGVDDREALDVIAHRIGATARSSVRFDAKEALRPLSEIIIQTRSDFTASGVQAKRLDVATLTFQPFEVRFGNWPPGCFEQRGHGIHRYLFVSDDGTLHNTDRWTAIHAELSRQRCCGSAAPSPVAFDPGQLVLQCDSRAQLPRAWSRAAVMCSGLLPIRRRTSDGRFVDLYRGVQETTASAIFRTLQQAPLRFSCGTLP